MPRPTAQSERYAEGLNARFCDPDRHYEVRAGVRFDKIVTTGRLGGGIHAFVERITGHVYKAESCTKAAPGIRFHNVEDAIEAADPFGTYLYR